MNLCHSCQHSGSAALGIGSCHLADCYKTLLRGYQRNNVFHAVQKPLLTDSHLFSVV